MPSMWWWSLNEDGRAAGGWQCDSNAKASRETMVVPRVRKYSIWIRPALTVKFYDNGEITMSEGEWRL
jgi:hypothetical protein